MKKVLLLIISIFISIVCSEAKCSCSTFISVYNDGIQTVFYSLANSVPIYAYIFPGDSVKLYVGSSHSCITNDLLMTYNGDIIFNGHAGDPDPSYSLTIFDTGFYRMDYYFYTVHRIFNLYVYYSTNTGIENRSDKNDLQVSPTVSAGIFKIKTSDKNLKYILITESSGRILLILSNNFSEIDLTRFSPSIYFYAIMDDKENVWRGRLVKE